MSDYLLGVELAGSQLKIASFVKDGNGYKIKSFDKLSFDIEKGEDKLTTWVAKNFPKDANISAVLSVPESTLYLKELTLPKLSKKQITEAVPWEIVGKTPFPKEDTLCEWKKLEESDGKIKVLAICARESSVTKIVSVFENIGVKINAVEPSTMSFERAAKANFAPITLLITVEHEETNLLVLKNSAPVFTTSISTPLTAEKTGKRRLKGSIIKDLAQQADKTVSFWEEKSGEKIAQVIITGDIAQKYWGLADAVNKLAKIPALMATQKKLSGVSFAKIANAVRLRYVIPIGAFYRFMAKDSEVNLLPNEKKEQVNKRLLADKIKQTSIMLSVINGALVALAILAIISLSLWNKSLVKIANQKTIQIKNHKGQALIQEVNKMNELATIADTLISKQKDIGTRLETISEMTPAGVTLSSIEFGQLEHEDWKLKGKADRPDVLSFYDKIAVDPFAKNVSMPYSNLAKETDNEFEIDLLW